MWEILFDLVEARHRMARSFEQAWQRRYGNPAAIPPSASTPSASVPAAPSETEKLDAAGPAEPAGETASPSSKGGRQMASSTKALMIALLSYQHDCGFPGRDEFPDKWGAYIAFLKLIIEHARQLELPNNDLLDQSSSSLREAAKEVLEWWWSTLPKD
jgi:hypothetical protein